MLGYGCIESFDLKNVSYDNLLVVEGHISNLNRPHQIKLSRTGHLNENVFIAESGANVTVENELGELIQFLEITPGIYESTAFAGVVGQEYTLYITTSSGRKYESETAVLKAVPPIGKIYAEFVTTPERGIKISVDTEDPTNNTHYYRWNYVETYEIITPYESNYWVPPGTNTAIWRFDRVDHCWASDTLRDVLIRNTKQQSQDKVVAFQLRFIPEESYIFRVKYSILVQQYALSQQAYNYWEKTKVFNDKQGSLADVQPGTIISNVRSVTNPSETVLGYFDASAISEQRVFFNYKDFKAAGYERPEFRSWCLDLIPIYVPVEDIGPFMEIHGEELIIWDVLQGQLELFPIKCCNCTDIGTPVKPSFWID